MELILWFNHEREKKKQVLSVDAEWRSVQLLVVPDIIVVEYAVEAWNVILIIAIFCSVISFNFREKLIISTPNAFIYDLFW